MILCADGGANYAYLMKLMPHYIIGDMDSIKNEVRDYYSQKQVIFKKFPKQKDFTDTQLVISYAEELGATEIVFFGTWGVDWITPCPTCTAVWMPAKRQKGHALQPGANDIYSCRKTGITRRNRRSGVSISFNG